MFHVGLTPVSWNPSVRLHITKVSLGEGTR